MVLSIVALFYTHSARKEMKRQTKQMEKQAEESNRLSDITESALELQKNELELHKNELKERDRLFLLTRGRSITTN